jgi:hypothetical protein
VKDDANETLQKPERNLVKTKKYIYNCIHCDNVFSNASSLGRHKKTCDVSKSKDIEVETLKKEYQKLQKEYEEKEKFMREQYQKQLV